MVDGGARRGEVFLADVSEHGGRVKKTRPVLVVQNDVGNRYSTESIVLAIRDPHGGRRLPVFVAVGKGTGGLAKDSIVDAGHIYTVRQADLGRRLGSMPRGVMDEVDRALRISLGLSLPRD